MIFNAFKAKRAGFTLIEIIMVLAIGIILIAIGTYWYNSAKINSTLTTTTDSIVSALEQAKTNAISGKNGQSYGVTFATTTYISFSGSSYNVSDPNNISHPVDSTLYLSNTLSSSTGVIIFARLTGSANATGTINIIDASNSSHKKSVIIGALGDISVI